MLICRVYLDYPNDIVISGSFCWDLSIESNQTCMVEIRMQKTPNQRF